MAESRGLSLVQVCCARGKKARLLDARVMVRKSDVPSDFIMEGKTDTEVYGFHRVERKDGVVLLVSEEYLERPMVFTG
jgi:hypothetical protein